MFTDSLATVFSRARVAARPRSRLQAMVPRGSRQTQARDWEGFLLDNAAFTDGTDAGQLMDGHTGRVMHKWRQYPSAYDCEFAAYRDGFRGEDGVLRPLRFLEIGVSEGGSQVFWRTYFGPDATVFGIDIDPTCADLVDPSVSHVRIGSQADPQFLRSVVAEMGGVDVVLDDGSHVADHQRASFATLWPLLTVGGVYVIEDTHTSYWERFGGGLRREGTAVEQAKDVVDDMHRWYYRELGSDDVMAPVIPNVASVTFYDSVIAYRKRATVQPARVVRGREYRPGHTWTAAQIDDSDNDA